MTTRERKEARADKRRAWAGGRDAKALAALRQADAAIEGIPPGQPILVGHHSERRHRRALERHDNALFKGLDHQKMAQRHRERAGGIEDQLDRSVYRDDTDAVERLTDKLEGLEARRARIKEINGALRKCGGFEQRAAAAEAVKGLELSEVEVRDLQMAVQFNGHTKGYPPYALKNLGANVRRVQQQLDVARARRAAEQQADAEGGDE